MANHDYTDPLTTLANIKANLPRRREVYGRNAVCKAGALQRLHCANGQSLTLGGDV